MGEEALRGHITLMADEGLPIPEPSSMDLSMEDPDTRSGTPVRIPAPQISAKAVRGNITIPQDALNLIDAYAEAHGYTRSELR